MQAHWLMTLYVTILVYLCMLIPVQMAIKGNMAIALLVKTLLFALIYHFTSGPVWRAIYGQNIFNLGSSSIFSQGTVNRPILRDTIIRRA